MCAVHELGLVFSVWGLVKIPVRRSGAKVLVGGGVMERRAQSDLLAATTNVHLEKCPILED